eukprot:3789237-Rhodomonas_salina.6
MSGTGIAYGPTTCIAMSDTDMAYVYCDTAANSGVVQHPPIVLRDVRYWHRRNVLRDVRYKHGASCYALPTACPVLTEASVLRVRYSLSGTPLGISCYACGMSGTERGYLATPLLRHVRYSPRVPCNAIATECLGQSEEDESAGLVQALSSRDRGKLPPKQLDPLKRVCYSTPLLPPYGSATAVRAAVCGCSAAVYGGATDKNGGTADKNGGAADKNGGGGAGRRLEQVQGGTAQVMVSPLSAYAYVLRACYAVSGTDLAHMLLRYSPTEFRTELLRDARY